MRIRSTVTFPTLEKFPLIGEDVDVRGVEPPHTEHHFAVGITNSAPLPMLSGQRCMIDFCLV